jgi:hypothetical protein
MQYVLLASFKKRRCTASDMLLFVSPDTQQVKCMIQGREAHGIGVMAETYGIMPSLNYA